MRRPVENHAIEIYRENHERKRETDRNQEY